MARSSRGLRGRERLNETQEASIESLEWWGMGEGLSGLGSVVSSSVEWGPGVAQAVIQTKLTRLFEHNRTLFNMDNTIFS